MLTSAGIPGHMFKEISLRRISKGCLSTCDLRGETLGFTRRHIDCCFPELQKLAKSRPPQWMANQINQDLVT